MCGIAGYFSVDKLFSKSELSVVGESIAHRGPEYQGVFADEFVGLVHRRLKIIDLSSAANQPMVSEDGRYVIVYNGEVYNYDDLRRERGMAVSTSSDTEVVLNLLIQDGLEAPLSFNGMYAIAFYDTYAKELVLIRDRMGVKPLYYYWDGSSFAFASEIKALLSFNYIKKNKTVSYESLNTFLHIGYCGQEDTIYSHIHKLPAGSIMKITRAGVHTTSYWDSYSCIREDCVSDYYQAKEILRDLVEQSVRYRLRSDVPFGTFLSGGVDSSLVTAVAQRNLSQRLQTFTISFEDAKHDESSYAKAVADYLGTDHTELLVTENEAKELIPTLIQTFDEPFADSSAIPTMLVSQLAKRSSTMILSGDGGDELFMGYGAYIWARRLENKWIKMFRKPLYAISQCGNSWSKRGGAVLAYETEETKPSHIFSQEQNLFSRKEIKAALNPEFFREISLRYEHVRSHRQLSASENQSLFDINYYLREDLLPKVDRSSMKYSLEVRVPLLDYTIVEFALNLNEDLKLHGNTQKYLLKQVLYDYIPAQLFDRPKWGFSMPLCKWLQKDLHFLIDDYLNNDLILKHRIFNPSYVQKIVRKFETGRYDYLYNRIWQMILIHQFMEEKI